MGSLTPRNRWFALFFAATAAALWSVVAANWDASLGLEAEAPVAVGIPLFIWLVAPWTFRNDSKLPDFCLFFGGAVVFTFGLLTVRTTVAVIGWNLMLWSWLLVSLENDSLKRARALFLLPLMAFPWLKMDGNGLSLCIRLVDAWIVQQLYGVLDVATVRDGSTIITAQGPMKIVDECAGLNMLHGLVIVAVVFAYWQRHYASISATVTKLAVLSVLANSLRIVLLFCLALVFGNQTATGPLHGITGCLVLIWVFQVGFGSHLKVPLLRRARYLRPLPVIPG